MSNQRGGGQGPPQYVGRAPPNPYAQAHSVDTDYDPITVDELVPAVPANVPRGYNSQGNQPQGAWGAQPNSYNQGQQGPPPPVPFAASTTNAYAAGNMARDGRQGNQNNQNYIPQQSNNSYNQPPPGYGAPSSNYGPPGNQAPPPTLFSAGPAGGGPPPPPGNGSNLFGGDAGASSSQAQGGGPGGAVLPDPATFAYWNIRRYRPYFDVDTRDVLWRVANSMYGMFKADFMETTMSRPDLYGPFWISTTLVFITAVAGNFASYITWFKDTHTSPPPPSPYPAGFAPPPVAVVALVTQEWFNDYTKLSVSIGMYYGYTFFLSFLLFCVLRYFKSEMQLVNVWCIYGYAMTIFLPVSLGCIVPLEWLRWTLVGVATLVSGAFLVMNFKATIYAIAPAKAILCLIVIALCHIGLGLGLKLYFFSY